jgi:ubiquinone/menaquinone biosynthesis C-methylase UbiE
MSARSPSQFRCHRGRWGWLDCPRGRFGWIAGKIMEWGNAAMNALAVEALEVQPDDQVLEIGFGPGAALAEIARLAPRGFAAGIDPSEAMISQVSRKLRNGIAAERVELKLGTASSIPYEDGRFDRVLTVNSIYFWDQTDSALREIRRVMQRGGRFVLVFRATPDEAGALRVRGMASRPSLDDILGWMAAASFANLSTRTRETRLVLSRVTAVAMLGEAA